ncbi:MAG: D-alanine--D-alanine ligase [Firmicutes bacterium]|nr:D-alanine--D-alanine ligase [Bacillota bacterium]
MEKKNILVLFGGVSPEHDISIVSANTIIKNLSVKKYKVVPVYITKTGQWLLYDAPISELSNIDWDKFGTTAILSPDRSTKGLLRIVGEKVRTIPIDIVFPVIHGETGEDGVIQGLCRLAGLPFVGCDVATSAICLDKSLTKIVAKQTGLPQAKYLAFSNHDLYELDENDENSENGENGENDEKAEKSQDAKINEIAKKIRYSLGYPCFVKPASAGSSVGISKATNKKELIKALNFASAFSNKVVVEQAVKARELECGVIGYGNDIKVSVVGEIVPAADFYDYDAKYNNPNSQTVVPADIPKDIAEKIQQMAKDIFIAVDGRGLARVDFFWDGSKILFNEINTVPGFTSISMFAMVWAASGLSLPNLLDTLIEISEQI